jgi:hypothetical protein
LRRLLCDDLFLGRRTVGEGGPSQSVGASRSPPVALGEPGAAAAAAVARDRNSVVVVVVVVVSEGPAGGETTLLVSCLMGDVEEPGAALENSASTFGSPVTQVRAGAVGGRDAFACVDSVTGDVMTATSTRSGVQSSVLLAPMKTLVVFVVLGLPALFELGVSVGLVAVVGEIAAFFSGGVNVVVVDTAVFVHWLAVVAAAEAAGTVDVDLRVRGLSVELMKFRSYSST